MKTPIRISHLAKFYPPEYGGIESVTASLAEDHNALGHRVEVICFTREKSAETHPQPPFVRRHTIWKEKHSQPISFAYFISALKAVGTSDITHVHAPNVLAALAAIAAPRRCKVVVHWHADIEGKGVLGTLIRPLEFLMLSRADKVVTTSAAYRDSSSSLRRWKEKTVVIPIGIEDSNAPSSDVPPDGSILFVGRLVPYKGLPVLLKAIAEMQVKAKLNIVGTGPEAAYLSQQVTTLGLENRVRFLGRVDQDILDELFSRASVFCLPSVNRLEAFGVVLLEAMRSGCPAVSSDIPGSGVPWVNESGITFSVGDHSELAARLDDILQNSVLRTKLASEAARRFSRLFQRQKMSAEFLSLYEKMLNR